MCCGLSLQAQTAQELSLAEYDSTILSSSEFRSYIDNPKAVTSKILSLSQEGLTKVYANKNIEAFNCFITAFSLVKYVPEDSLGCLVGLHQNMADLLFHSKAYYPAFRYAKEALRLIGIIHPKPNGDTYILLGKIGSFYMFTGEYDSAKVYYDKAIIEARGTEKNIWMSASLNNMGMLAMETGHPDSAMQLFEQSLASLKMNIINDSIFSLSIKDNMADNYLAMGSYNKAIAIYKENLPYFKKYGDYKRLLMTYMDMADAHLRLGNRIQAKIYLDSAKSIDIIMPVENLINMEKLLKNYHLASGNMQEAFKTQDRIQHITDSVAQQTSRFLDQLSEKLIYSQLDKFSKDIQIQELELKRAAQEAQIAKAKARQSYMWILIVAFFGIGLITFLFLIFKNRSKMQQKNIEMHEYEKKLAEANLKNEELEKEKLSQELQYKKDDITDLSLYLTKLKDTNKDLLDKLKEVVKESEDDTKGTIKKVVKELNAKIKVEKKNNLLIENSDKVNKEFYAKLKNQYPDLTKSEVELCGLLRLNMTNKEVGVLRNVSPQSVKMARYRLRKKLSLKPEEDIYLFLATI